MIFEFCANCEIICYDNPKTKPHKFTNTYICPFFWTRNYPCTTLQNDRHKKNLALLHPVMTTQTKKKAKKRKQNLQTLQKNKKDGLWDKGEWKKFLMKYSMFVQEESINLLWQAMGLEGKKFNWRNFRRIFGKAVRTKPNIDIDIIIKAKLELLMSAVLKTEKTLSTTLAAKGLLFLFLFVPLCLSVCLSVCCLCFLVVSMLARFACFVFFYVLYVLAFAVAFFF